MTSSRDIVWDRRTLLGNIQLPPKQRHGYETLPPLYSIPRNVRLIVHRRIVTFLIIAPYMYSLLLLTCYLLVSFLLINIYGSSIEKNVQTKFLLEGLESHKDTQMKAYDIKKNCIRYRNECITLCCPFRGRGYQKHVGAYLHTVKVIYRTRIVGRREVTVRFIAKKIC